MTSILIADTQLNKSSRHQVRCKISGAIGTMKKLHQSGVGGKKEMGLKARRNANSFYLESRYVLSQAVKPVD